MATSPNVDARYYKNLNLFFMRHMNIEVWDQAAIEISTDDGTTWNPIWESNSYLSDFQWFQNRLLIPDDYSRSELLKIRFKLGPTDGFNNYSGWNIDDIYLTGEFISKDVGVSKWIAPLSGSGHTAGEPVTVQVRNYGGAEIVDPVPVAYSFDGGASWTSTILTRTFRWEEWSNLLSLRPQTCPNLVSDLRCLQKPPCQVINLPATIRLKQKFT